MIMWYLVEAGKQGSHKNVIFCAHVEVWLTVISVFYPFLFFQYELQRISFDEAISSLKGSKDTLTADAIRNMLRKLLFFYSESKDTLQLLCNLTSFFNDQLKTYTYLKRSFSLKPSLLSILVSFPAPSTRKKKLKIPWYMTIIPLQLRKG